jgi:hypothetical protein
MVLMRAKRLAQRQAGQSHWLDVREPTMRGLAAQEGVPTRQQLARQQREGVLQRVPQQRPWDLFGR